MPDPDPPTAPSTSPEVYEIGTVRATHGNGSEPDSKTSAAPSPDEIPAPEIPGYTILEVLGRGGMGIVYKALDHQLDRKVAVKMVAIGTVVTAAARARFQAEARAVALLQHSHIAQVYVAEMIENRPYFVMEYVNGGSLSQKIVGEPQSPRYAAQLVAKLAQAIDFSHGKNVIHRDLKPGNVLLTQAGEPKIADFGLAKFLDSDSSSTKTGDILGTPSYMAPEQAGGVVKKIGPGCDIYSLGAILYELLTGRPPFRTPDSMQTVLMVLSEEPVPPRKLQPTVPRDLETVCLKCLEKTPPKRYATAGDLAADLQRFLSDEPIHARRVGRWERSVKWAKRRPGWATLIGVCVLGMISAVAAAFYHNRQMQSEFENTTAERDRAERLFDNGHRLAKKLISKHYPALERLPGANRERERLAFELIQYLDRISKDAEDDTVLLGDLADAYTQIAYVQGNPYGEDRGAKQKAIKNYHKALALRRRILASKPGELLPQLQLQICRRHIADMTFQMGKIETARTEYGDILKRLEILRREFPQENRVLAAIVELIGRLGDVDEAEESLIPALKRYQEALKRSREFLPSNAEKRKVHESIRNESYFRIGQLLEKLQRIKEAERSYIKYYEYAKRSFEEDAASVFSQNRLSRALLALGDIRTHRRDYEKAREYYHAALKIRRKTALDASHTDKAQENLAVVLGRIGLSYQSDRKNKLAIPLLSEALRIRETVAARNKTDIERTKNLGIVQRQLAEVLSTSPQIDRAALLYRQCLKSADHLETLQKNSPVAKVLRAEALLGLGILQFIKAEAAFAEKRSSESRTLFRSALTYVSQSRALWIRYAKGNAKDSRAKSYLLKADKLGDYIESQFKKRFPPKTP